VAVLEETGMLLDGVNEVYRKDMSEDVPRSEVMI
jgi:hypothetical protein